MEFATSEPFVVRSQSADYPFMLFACMTGPSTAGGYGDADFVRVVPADQYLKHYAFFTDPSYRDTNVVMVRKKDESGFHDVNLECAGLITGWNPLGSSGLHAWARIDLVRGNFQPQGGCDNGRHVLSSEGRIGAWVWGWGGPDTSGGDCDSGTGVRTCHVSYGYPAGEGVLPINQVVIPPVVK